VIERAGRTAGGYTCRGRQECARCTDEDQSHPPHRENGANEARAAPMTSRWLARHSGFHGGVTNHE
jgi:hypothetical protein